MIHFSGVCFDDIAGQELVKQELRENVTLAVLRPELFTGLRTPAQRIVLIGPEGNGKTMLAKAVAKESKATFFNICGSSLPSADLSDVRKFVEVLFAVAQEMQPSIIFFEFTSDESDVSFYELLDILREVQKRVDDRVIIMAAHSSSYPDHTLNRGFEKVIFVDMLTEEGRLQLIQNMLGNHGNSLSQEDIHHIAK
ncbi:spastin-like [Aplochiton taeniatus]